MTNPDSTPNEGFLQRYGPLLRHWLIFVMILGAFVALSEWSSDWVNDRFTRFTAVWLGLSLKLLGIDAIVDGVRVNCSVCKFTIIGECTAYYPLAIFISAVLAFPSPWVRRILGVGLGVPALLVINQGRLVSLCYLYEWFPDHFEFLHIVVWQSLMIFITVVLWIVWVSTLGDRR